MCEKFEVRGMIFMDIVRKVDDFYKKFKDTPNFKFMIWGLNEILDFLENDREV